VDLTPTSIFIALGSLFPEVPHGAKQLTDSAKGISLPPVLPSVTNSGEILGRAQLSDNITQSSMAAYPARSGRPSTEGRYPRKDPAPPVPDTAELGLDGLQELSQLIQSQLAKQLRKAEAKTTGTSSTTTTRYRDEKAKVYYATELQDSALESGHDDITYAGLAVPIPDDRRMHVRQSIPKRIMDPEDSSFDDSGSEGPAY
jgi:hypothetical protein